MTNFTSTRNTIAPLFHKLDIIMQFQKLSTGNDSNSILGHKPDWFKRGEAEAIHIHLELFKT